MKNLKSEKNIEVLFRKLVQKEKDDHIGLPLSNGIKSSFFIYLFFLVHMAAFGFSGFMLAYKVQDFPFALIHGGIAIIVYLIFYLFIFGADSIYWLFLNSIIGIAQVKVIINLLGNMLVSDWNFDNYPVYYHIIPGIYVILYTFLLRRFLIDLFNAKVNKNNKKYANLSFAVINIVLYLFYIF